MTSKDKIYWQLVVESPKVIDGGVVAYALKSCARFGLFTSVAVCEFDGFGSGFGALREERLWGLDSLLQQLPLIHQVIWGDFFCMDSPSLYLKLNGMSYGDTLRVCPLIIRCVDGDSLYFYGESAQLRGSLESFLDVSRSVAGCADSLEFPF